MIAVRMTRTGKPKKTGERRGQDEYADGAVLACVRDTGGKRLPRGLDIGVPAFAVRARTSAILRVACRLHTVARNSATRADGEQRRDDEQEARRVYIEDEAHPGALPAPGPAESRSSSPRGLELCRVQRDGVHEHRARDEVGQYGLEGRRHGRPRRCPPRIPAVETGARAERPGAGAQHVAGRREGPTRRHGRSRTTWIRMRAYAGGPPESATAPAGRARKSTGRPERLDEPEIDKTTDEGWNDDPEMASAAFCIHEPTLLRARRARTT